MTDTTQMLDEYRQSYLNAKANGELPNRVFFTQLNNEGEYLKYSKGNRFGDGFYAIGQMVDRNVQNTPTKYQHSTSPELILSQEDYLMKFSGDIETAMDAGYVGVKYENSVFSSPMNNQDQQYGSYYLFPETVPQAQQVNTNKSEITTDVYTNPVNGEKTPMHKRNRRWHIDGVNKQFKSKDKAIKYLEDKYSFLNY